MSTCVLTWVLLHLVDFYHPWCIFTYLVLGLLWHVQTLNKTDYFHKKKLEKSKIHSTIEQTYANVYFLILFSTITNKN